MIKHTILDVREISNFDNRHRLSIDMRLLSLVKYIQDDHTSDPNALLYMNIVSQ